MDFVFWAFVFDTLFYDTWRLFDMWSCGVSISKRASRKDFAVCEVSSPTSLLSVRRKTP